MAEVPGLDRKINAWLYRHDRPGLQFSSWKSVHLPHFRSKPCCFCQFWRMCINPYFFFFFFLLFCTGNLHVTCVTEVSQKSGHWTIIWSCILEKNPISAHGLPAIIPFSQLQPWRTTTGLIQVWLVLVFSWCRQEGNVWFRGKGCTGFSQKQIKWLSLRSALKLKHYLLWVGPIWSGLRAPPTGCTTGSHAALSIYENVCIIP